MKAHQERRTPSRVDSVGCANDERYSDCGAGAIAQFAVCARSGNQVQLHCASSVADQRGFFFSNQDFLVFESQSATAPVHVGDTLTYSYAVDTKYYSAALTLRCATAEHRSWSSVLDELACAGGLESKPIAPLLGCGSVDELAAQCDALCRRLRNVFFFPACSCLASSCTAALVIVYDSTRDGGLQKARQFEALIRALSPSIVALVDRCTDGAQALSGDC